MLVVFPPIFAADTKVIYGYNFVAPLSSSENSNPETYELIINLESKLLLRFDNLDKEMLNLKDVIIKYLQVENQRLRNKTNNLKKVITLEEATIPWSNMVEGITLKSLEFQMMLMVRTLKRK